MMRFIFRLNFNISKVSYSFVLKIYPFLQVDFLKDQFQCKKKKTVIPSVPFYRNQSQVQSGRIFIISETLENTETVQQITSKSDRKKGSRKLKIKLPLDNRLLLGI